MKDRSITFGYPPPRFPRLNAYHFCLLPAPLLANLRGHFAEFLKINYPITLCPLVLVLVQPKNSARRVRRPVGLSADGAADGDHPQGMIPRAKSKLRLGLPHRPKGRSAMNPPLRGVYGGAERLSSELKIISFDTQVLIITPHRQQ